MITPAAHMHRSPGHTLWEVLLVLAVLGAICALAAPSVAFVRPPAGHVSEATHDIVALLQNARLTALQRGTTVEVRLDPSTAHAWVFAAEGDTLRLISMPTLPHLSAVEVLAGAAPRFRYAFTPDGYAFGQPLVVRRFGEIGRVDIDPWTGGANVTR